MNGKNTIKNAKENNITNINEIYNSDKYSKSYFSKIIKLFNDYKEYTKKNSIIQIKIIKEKNQSPTKNIFMI